MIDHRRIYKNVNSPKNELRGDINSSLDAHPWDENVKRMFTGEFEKQ